jgi:hypothetical protein
MWRCLCCDRVRKGAVILSGGEHCPRYTCQLVGHRDDQHVAWRSRLEGSHPCTHRDALSLGSRHHGASAMDEDLAQVPVAPLADPVELGLAASRVLLR